MDSQLDVIQYSFPYLSESLFPDKRSNLLIHSFSVVLATLYLIHFENLMEISYIFSDRFLCAHYDLNPYFQELDFLISFNLMLASSASNFII